MNPSVRKWIESRALAKEDEKFLKAMAFIQVQEIHKPALPEGWTDPQAWSKVCTVCDLTGLPQREVISEVMMEASEIAQQSTGESLDEIFKQAFRKTAKELVGHNQELPTDLLDS